jgi:hypothetical protein
MEEDCTHEHCIIRVEQRAQKKEITLHIMWGSLICFFICVIASIIAAHRDVKRRLRKDGF